MIGRSDERENPGRATAGRGRLIVMVSFAEPIWASGHRAASTGRTHDRRGTAIKFCRIPLALQRPFTHAHRHIYRAFREIGRAERRLFLLRFLADTDIRRTIRAETTKIEVFNDFLDWVLFGGPVIKSGDPAE